MERFINKAQSLFCMNIKEIEKDIFICGLGIYLKKSKMLVVSDFHLGYEEMLNEQGILIPRINFKEIKKELENIFKILKERSLKIEKIVINGDLKHEFGEISRQEWREVLRMINFLENSCKDIILIKGNHDTILGPLAERKNLEIVDYLKIDKILILHGHKIPNRKILDKSKVIIIAHEHPAVGLRETQRVEKVKCFLKGKWNKKMLIAMPSLFSISIGTDVLQQKLISPFLQGNLENFEAYLIENGKIYYFGKLRYLYV